MRGRRLETPRVHLCSIVRDLIREKTHLIRQEIEMNKLTTAYRDWLIPDKRGCRGYRQLQTDNRNTREHLRHKTRVTTRRRRARATEHRKAETYA